MDNLQQDCPLFIEFFSFNSVCVGFKDPLINPQSFYQ